MKDNIKNTRGFTLVELLAVIVVLAIVMLAAVQAVIPRMNEARRQVFAIEANGIIDSAQTYFMNNSLMGNNTNSLPVAEGAIKCVTVATLIDNGYSDLSKSYSGRVAVKKSGNLYIYVASLQNGQLMVMNRGVEDTMKYNKDITSADVTDYNSGTFASHTSCDGFTWPTVSGS